MKNAFEIAVELSYYAGKLWDIATNPDISAGRSPADYEKILVVKYGEPENGQTMLSGNVAGLLAQKFEDIAKIGISETNENTRVSLQRTLSTLDRITSLTDPAKGYTTHFSNLQQPLIQELPRIKAAAEILEFNFAN